MMFVEKIVAEFMADRESGAWMMNASGQTTIVLRIVEEKEPILGWVVFKLAVVTIPEITTRGTDKRILRPDDGKWIDWWSEAGILNDRVCLLSRHRQAVSLRCPLHFGLRFVHR